MKPLGGGLSGKKWVTGWVGLQMDSPVPHPVLFLIHQDVVSQPQVPTAMNSLP